MTDYLWYEIEKGDTLSAIAQRFLGKADHWRTLMQVNKPFIKDPDVIFPGAQIRIPIAYMVPLNPLTSKDGKFMSTPESAVDAAYILNTAEAVAMNGGFDFEVGEVLAAYVAGRLSAEETREEFITMLADMDAGC